MFSLNFFRDIFNELRVASKGGTADYFGITWDRVETKYRGFGLTLL